MTQVIVLAAGQGKRMGNKLPKALVFLHGKPLIKYLVESVKKSFVCQRPTIVVSPDNKNLIEQVVDGCNYVIQEKQLGTGHAVACAREYFEDNQADDILVLYGDHPLLTEKTIRKLDDLHKKEQSVLTMMTCKVPDFQEWRAPFYDFGRIIRDGNGEIVEIIEKKDASLDQLAIKEINPSFFCFKAKWLWQNLNKLKNDNAQKEYYLTDLAGLAISQGHKIASVEIDPSESLGVNTQEQLELVRGMAKGFKMTADFENIRT